ncbi:MAG: guanylate kinase [Chlorobiaceae bacterium]
MLEERKEQGKLVVFSAPSGTGKSTIAKLVLDRFQNIRFSISATTREKRAGEVEGINYYFINKQEFKEKINLGGFIEHEFLLGNYYGTLLDKTFDIINSGTHLLLDIDVKGALNLKSLFPENSLLLFFIPPSMAVLEKRLKSRESEDAGSLKSRLERAWLEMEYSDRFDKIIINDDLDRTIEDVSEIIDEFLSKRKI